MEHQSQNKKVSYLNQLRYFIDEFRMNTTDVPLFISVNMNTHTKICLEAAGFERIQGTYFSGHQHNITTFDGIGMQISPTLKDGEVHIIGNVYDEKFEIMSDSIWVRWDIGKEIPIEVQIPKFRTIERDGPE